MKFKDKRENSVDPDGVADYEPPLLDLHLLKLNCVIIGPLGG